MGRRLTFRKRKGRQTWGGGQAMFGIGATKRQSKNLQPLASTGPASGVDKEGTEENPCLSRIKEQK